MTVGQALEGLGEPHRNKEMLADDSHRDVTPERDRERIHGVPEGSHLAAQLHLPIAQRCRLTKKDTTKFRDFPEMNHLSPCVAEKLFIIQ